MYAYIIRTTIDLTISIVSFEGNRSEEPERYTVYPKHTYTTAKEAQSHSTLEVQGYLIQNASQGQ